MRCLVLIATVGCTSDAARPSDKPVEGPPPKLAGVYPEKFECSSIASTTAMSEILGAPTRSIDTPSSVPRGLPRPCNYEVAKESPEYWTFDFDCRDGYKQRADALFAQYKQMNTDRIQQYNELSDAGPPKPGPKKPPPDPAFKDVKDAGVPELRHPGTTVEVSVGAKAIDHNDQGLLFIDDDAPCYVRIIGPDASRRLELAKYVAKRLTFANAPMSPRPLK